MNLDFWKKTGTIKPFTLEEWDQFTEDIVKLPKLDSFINTPMRKSKVKKGVNVQSEKFDSFTEFAFVQYQRLIQFAIVERNVKSLFFHYTDTNGKMCKFFPDFLVNGVPVEIKGRLSEKDRCKLEQCTNVVWYFQADVNRMMGELDAKIPNWRSDFLQTN